MKKLCLLIFLSVVSLVVCAGQSVSGLKCEHLESPVGIDAVAPRLAWMLPEGVRRQAAYSISVGTDPEAVSRGEGNMWNSGRIDSDDVLVRYSGQPLSPFTEYFWKVSVWTDASEVLESYVASFETGMMDQDNWEGCWISDHNGREHKPAPYFRKCRKLSGRQGHILPWADFMSFISTGKG